jgi:ribosome biogenesis GTPase
LNLKTLGITDELEAQITPSFNLGRVIGLNRTQFTVGTDQGVMQATLAGRLVNLAFEPEDFPTVGDWVGLRIVDTTAIIERLLPRKSVFLRKVAGRTSSVQLVTANVDMLLICMALDQNFNLRRLERYLAIANASGSQATIILTKTDRATDLDAQRTAVENIAEGKTVILCNAMTESGIDELKELLQPRQTYAFIGSSGVGKSTLINRLLNQEQLITQAVRENDAHGRHTTTSRDLFELPNGALVIDTPGMRELGLLDADLDTTFQDILGLAVDCKFRDCTHQHEPGCAVQKAVNTGTLDADRLASFLRLGQEQAENLELRGKAREVAKINKMFGSKKQMKAVMQKARNKRR